MNLSLNNAADEPLIRECIADPNKKLVVEINCNLPWVHGRAECGAIEGLTSIDLRRQFKAYADSLRALRAAGKLPEAPGIAPDTDPFANQGLMAVVKRNIQRLVAGQPIHEKSVNGMVADDPDVTYPTLDLSEYELVRETERIRVYNVTDNASGRRFEVLFLVYGGVISGWDVRSI